MADRRSTRELSGAPRRPEGWGRADEAGVRERARLTRRAAENPRAGAVEKVARKVARGRRSSDSDGLQRLNEVVDEIPAVLESGADADKSVGQTEFPATLPRHLAMRGRRRVTDEGVGTTE